MENDRRNFADDLDFNKGDGDSEKSPDFNRYNTPSDKWNAIQEEYIAKFPELEAEDLYFESGGFEGVLEKISEIRGKSIKEIRTEIENW